MTSQVLDDVPDTIKRAILAARAPEPLRTYLQLNSQSVANFLESRQAINQYLKARKEANGKDKGKGKPKGKGKGIGKGRNNEKGKSAGKGKSSQETLRGPCRNCGKIGHTWSECLSKGGRAAKQANSVGERENR